MPNGKGQQLTTHMKTTIENVSCGDGLPLVLIAGPCVIQSRELTLSIATSLQSMCERLAMPLVFKASFDKANRTSRSGFRGLGMEEGLRVLEDVHRTLGVPTVTDIHLPQQAAPSPKSVICCRSLHFSRDKPI